MCVQGLSWDLTRPPGLFLARSSADREGAEEVRLLPLMPYDAACSSGRVSSPGACIQDSPSSVSTLPKSSVRGVIFGTGQSRSSAVRNVKNKQVAHCALKPLHGNCMSYQQQNLKVEKTKSKAPTFIPERQGRQEHL